MKDKSVKAMLCDVMKYRYGFDSIEFTKYKFSNRWIPVLECWYAPSGAPDSEWVDVHFIYGSHVSLDASGNIQAVSKG